MGRNRTLYPEDFPPEVLAFATDRQRVYIETSLRLGSMRRAAEDLKVNFGNVYQAFQRVKEKAALRGISPRHHLTREVAPGQKLRGVSSLYKKGEPEPVLQWVKSQDDKEQRERIMREWVDWLMEDARGLAPSIAGPTVTDADLLACYPLGDPHFGMYAWAQEAGEDFDLAEAERITTAAIDRLVGASPPTELGLLINLGDFFHADDSKNRTPESGHALDVDTRYAKVMQVGLRAVVHCIKRMLEKHAKVIAWMLPGNHDPHSSYALALALGAWFQNEPRVQVDMSPALFRYLEFGKVLIGAHHGHAAKRGELPGIMATDQAEAWGRTIYRHWYCGHIHHKTRDMEHPGATVETFRTLAARDAWHTGKGYRAGRDASLILHHREHGEIMRVRCGKEMVEKEAA